MKRKFNFKGKRTYGMIIFDEDPTEPEILIGLPINKNSKKFKEFKKSFNKFGGNENITLDFELKINLNKDNVDMSNVRRINR